MLVSVEQITPGAGGPSPLVHSPSGAGPFDAWQALSEGAWSQVDTFESNGRRFLVARRNAEHVRTRSDNTLSPLETHALTLRGHGASYKVIAAELHVSVASAHRILRSGLRKLGISNESEVPWLLEACAQVAQQPARCDAAR
jgi:DNA-binding CsgD family transcriptional regulator